MVQRFATERNIRWTFNTPRAPWIGEFYERLVQSVKRRLQRSVGQTELTYVELQTVLQKIELILNSRPMGPIFDDNQEFLTPNHLLFWRKLSTYNDKDEYVPVKILYTKRCNYLKQVVDHYWKRWSTDYLTTSHNYERASKENVLGPNVFLQRDLMSDLMSATLLL